MSLCVARANFASTVACHWVDFVELNSLYNVAGMSSSIVIVAEGSNSCPLPSTPQI